MSETMNVILRVESEAVDKLLLENKGMKRMLDNLVKKLLLRARGKVSRDARGNMGEDPRAAYRAVRYSVYRGVIGGNISILNKRKASAMRVTLNRQRKLDINPSQRGGNRVKRVDDGRNRLDQYYGNDRGFILRFIQGTGVRESRYGNRGAIAGRKWFESSSTLHLQEVVELFNQGVAEYIESLDRKKGEG